MRIYLATPISARRGHNMRDKLAAARRRIANLKDVLANDVHFCQYEAVSTFDLNDVAELTEAEAMGRCIQLVLTCDAIYLDHGWLQSKGCNLEYRAAKIYGIKIYEHDKL